MARQKRVMLRTVILAAWLLAALVIVGPVLAQGGEGSGGLGVLNGGQGPQDLDDIAVRLMPLLVGAALIERTIEVIFTWTERALIDAGHRLNQFAGLITGLVSVDLRHAWDEVSQLTNALLQRQMTTKTQAFEGDSESNNPHDWPLAMLEERLKEAKQRVETAQLVMERSIKSPQFVAQKKMAAAVLSMGFGLVLATVASLRLFQPLGVEAASWFDEPFDIVDLVMAGVLMGLGTEWVHQVIGILIKSKDALSRVGLAGQAGSLITSMDLEQLRRLAEQAVTQELKTQIGQVQGNLAGNIAEQVVAATSQAQPVQAASATATTAAALATAAAAAAAGEISDQWDIPETEAEAATLADNLLTPVHVTNGATNGLVMPGLGTAAPMPEMSLALPENGLPLDAVRVMVRAGGAAVFAAPRADSDPVGELAAGDQVSAQAAVLNSHTWLQILWDDGTGRRREGYIIADATDFARSRAYDQVSRAWIESGPVLAFRKRLVCDLMRVRGVEEAKISRVNEMRPEALEKFETLLTRQTMPPDYIEFWRLQDRLRLPDPFVHLPVHPLPPSSIDSLEIQGFGPTTYAAEQWPVYYSGTRGLHTGVDYLVPEGSPLLAVADGVIVDFRIVADANERMIALRPFLPDRLRRPDGSRALSNVVVVYSHLTGDPSSNLVGVGDVVHAGQVIGTSGWPVYTSEDGVVQVQYNNAHLHLEVHLVNDSAQGPTPGNRQPFNPLLFFAPHLIAFQARLADHSPWPPYPSSGHSLGRLGFLVVACFSYEPPTIFWEHIATGAKMWPSGVVPLGKLLAAVNAAAHQGSD